MKNPDVGFIGGGRVVSILLAGWSRAGRLPAKVAVFDPNAAVVAGLKARHPAVEVSADPRDAASRDMVFVAVHPPAMAEAVAGIKGFLRPDALLVSLAPKFTLARLSELLGGFGRVARVIPNAPSVVGHGFNPVAYAPGVTAADRAALGSLLEPLGECPEVDEPKLEAYAILTAMGPTYLWFQLQALREVAAGLGLDDAETSTALKRMVCGATRTLLESGLSPAEAMDLIPVKPLAEMEQTVGDLYRTRLPALYQKIKP
jgi:pyrroline-5-carboxylate reductase